MATAGSNQAVCSIVKVGTLELETKAGHTPDYSGILKMEDMLVTVDVNAWNLQVNNSHDGKLITSHRLDDIATDVCLISKNKVAVCLFNGTVVILSLKSIDDVKLVKTLQTGFYCLSLAKFKSDKLIVSGVKDRMLCWGILSIRDGRIESTHDICKGFLKSDRTRIAVKDNNVYISCRTWDSINNGIYVYDILNPKTKKFLYQLQELKDPWSIMADRDYVYVCDYDSNRIHQLTDSGQLVTIHTVSSSLDEIFYDDQQRLLYTTSMYSNVITVYKMESLHQQGVPIEILKMDDRSIQLFEEALKDGKETVHSIRIMVVGHMGVGKTTLVKRLLGEKVDISERHITEGIDVYVNCCDVSLSTHEWIRRTKDSEQDYKLQRLVKVLNQNYQTVGRDVDLELDGSSNQRETTDGNTRSHIADDDKNTKVLDRRSQQQNKDQNLLSTSSLQNESSSTVVQSSLNQSETITMPGSELGENVATDNYKMDPLREMLKLLQQNPNKAKQDISKHAHLTILDFAGQYAFYTTHQMFLTRRAIYLLVSDASRDVSDLVEDDCYFDTEGILKCKVHDLVQVWMNSIHSCAPPDKENLNSANSHTSSYKVLPPPVILVGTHIDQIPKDYCHECGQRYLKEIRSFLSDKPTTVHLVDEDFAIDNTILDSKLEELKKKIVEVASQQPHWGEQIPTRWFLLEQQLMRLRDAGVKVVSLSKVEELNKEGTVRIEESEELDLFLRYLHETGTIIYFSIEVLRDNILLDPKWMIDALKILINAQPNLPNNPADNDTESNSPADNNTESNSPADNNTESNSPADNDTESNSPADNDTESNSPADNVTESNNPADNDTESNSPADKNTESNSPADNNTESNSPADNNTESNSSADNDTESNSPAASAAHSDITRKWSDFKEKGILTVELVDAIWTKENHPDLHKHKEHILMIMEQLNILAKPRSFNEMGEKVEDYFLAPCMLRQESPTAIISPKEDPRMGRTPEMQCLFTGKYLPTPIFHRLLAACVAHWPVAKKKETSENLIFCGCCVFDLDLFHRLTVYMKNHVVFARITRMVDDEVKTPDTKLCSRVRRFITLNLSKITSYLGQNLQFELLAAYQTWLTDEGHDPDAPITLEHMNHARLYVVLVTVCGNAMRDILSTQLYPAHTDIHQAILANKNTLTKHLDPFQTQLVFPDPNTTGNVDQFDLSLLYKLIRNISTVTAPNSGWGKDPNDQPRDTSLGASVERIRSYRNHIIGHSSDGKISQQDFDDYWNKIDSVLNDIECELNKQGYRAQLEKQKKQVISVYEAC